MQRNLNKVSFKSVIHVERWLTHHWLTRTVYVKDVGIKMPCRCSLWKRLLYLIVGSALTACVNIKPNVALGVSTVAITSDCITTVTTPGVERNPILGPHPSTGRVIAWCAVGIGLNATVPNTIHASPTVKRIWWFSLAVWEFHEAIHNLTQ